MLAKNCQSDAGIQIALVIVDDHRRNAAWSMLAPTVVGAEVQPGTTVPHLSLCFCSLILQNRAPVSARALPVGYSDAFWPGGK